MKKLLLIATAIISVTSIGYAANAMLNVKDHSKCESGMKCSFCNGTGWQKGTSFKCSMCKGTGANSSY